MKSLLRNEQKMLFRACFPFAVREEQTVEAILTHPDVMHWEERDSDGHLIGCALLHQNTLLMLAVLPHCRRKGIGTRLLAACENAVKEKGFSSITVGSGAFYLLPGVPSRTSILAKHTAIATAEGIDPNATRFFEKRGYRHRWKDADCMDMTATLTAEMPDVTQANTAPDTVTYRFAAIGELAAILRCTDDAHPSFTKYYADPTRYTDPAERVVIATDGQDPVGAVIVKCGKDGAGIASLAALAVKHSHRGQNIGLALVTHATAYAKQQGMTKSFVGYTYSGVDRLYQKAGYQIATYYLMAEKML